MRAHAGYRALVLTALAVLGCVTATGQAAAAGARASAEPAATAPSGLSWVDCGDGFQCAYLQVPLDYAKPGGTKIRIALTKKPATSGTSKGAVVANAGTQSGGGVAFVRGFPSAFNEINRDFDVVGLDTRGVGNSQPLVRCTTYEENREIEAPLSAAQTVADRAQRIREANGLDALCKQHSAALLPYLSSTSSARDLDRVRIALGEQRLRFIGVSGGSILGQIYLAKFPTRVQAMVLDSPFDAKQYINNAFAFDIDQMVATERTLRTFFKWCETTPSLCTFGNGNPQAAFDQLMAKTKQNRIDNPGRWDIVTDGSLIDYVSGAMLFPAQWPAFAQSLAAMAAQPLPLEPLPTGDDRGYAEFYSQTCLDRKFPTSLAAFDQQLLKSKAAAPYLGGRYGYAEFKCRQWPAEAAERYDGPWNNPGNRPVLVLAANDDPLAPIRGAAALAYRLHAGFVLLRASGHIQVGRTPCADTKVSTFLHTGKPVYAACSVPLPGH